LEDLSDGAALQRLLGSGFAIPPDSEVEGQPLCRFLDPEAGSFSFLTSKLYVPSGAAACQARDLVAQKEIKEEDCMDLIAFDANS
jgi:hypothetical protein